MPRWLFCSRSVAAGFWAVCLTFTSAYGQNAGGPQSVPLPPLVPAPVDKPYVGTVSLSVDLTNVNDRVLNVHETIPVKPGEITLLYPEWLPGTHSPSNPVANMAGLVATADGKRVSWLRDSVNMGVFHLDVPKGTTTLELSFQYLHPLT